METKSFNIPTSNLYELIHAMPNPANIKEVSSGKYIAINPSELVAFGFKNTKEMLGLTVFDLDSFMRPYWGKYFAREVEELDEQVKSNSQLVIGKNRIFLDRNGMIHVRDVYKSPLFNENNSCKINAILTLTFDYTENVELTSLYWKYKELYKNKDIAIRYFMKYLKIADFFYEALTEKEILCLLRARLNQTHKNIALNLGVSIKTVETHLTNIVNKLKRVSIQDVMVFLRNSKGKYNEY